MAQFERTRTASSRGSREQTLPNKNNPHPDLSDADGDKPKLDLTDVQDISPAQSPIDQQRAQREEQMNSADGKGHCFASPHGYQLYEGADYDSSNESEEEINVTWFVFVFLLVLDGELLFAGFDLGLMVYGEEARYDFEFV